MEKHVRIGEFLVSINAISSAQVENIITLQKGGDSRLFGEIAVSMGYVDKSAIKKYFNMNG
jgi:hypothetical protein